MAVRSPRQALPERDDYAKLRRVGLLTSPPLSESIKVILKVSHNLHASTLPLLVAVKHGQRTLAQGMRLQQKRLAALGLDTATISFGGAAGGEQADEVTPRATVQLLRAMRARPDFAYFRDALPVLGLDGTLADVIDARSPARGKVWAKTGTLNYGSALAGYLFPMTDRPAVFVTMVSDAGAREAYDALLPYPGPKAQAAAGAWTARARALQDSLVESWIQPMPLS